jgi:hypothetical protein
VSTAGAAAPSASSLKAATPAQAAALPATAYETTMGAFDTQQGIGADPRISTDRSVWVVTVHGDMATDALPGSTPEVHNVYTEVYDVASGDLILTAIGVDASQGAASGN